MSDTIYAVKMVKQAIVVNDRFSDITSTIDNITDKINKHQALEEKINKKYRWRNAHRRYKRWIR